MFSPKQIFSVLILIWCGGFAAYIYGLYEFWSVFDAQTKIDEVPCYNPNKINDYGRVNPICDTSALNGTRFLAFNNEQHLCKNYCETEGCIDTTKIQIDGGIVSMGACYKNISYEYFSDNCDKCYPPNIANPLLYSIFVGCVGLPLFSCLLIRIFEINGKLLDDKDTKKLQRDIEMQN